MGGRARSLAAAVGCGLLLTGCVSATQLDFGLTRIGRAASPRLGQSLSRQVADASRCRVTVMDSLFYLGSYGVPPLEDWGTPARALYGLELKMVRCLRDLGYELPEPAPPPGPGASPKRLISPLPRTKMRNP